MTIAHTSLTAAIQHQIDSDIGPKLEAHAGGLELVGVSDEGDVTVKFLGACVGCSIKAATLGMGVIPVLESLPGVRSVAAVDVHVSPIALRRMAELSRGSKH